MEEKDNIKLNNNKALNALKHGILSKHTILSWESRKDYESLLSSLIEEYNPQHATEEHLVEELAVIIWKKGRLRYAERAYHQQALNDCINPEIKDEKFLLTGSYDTTFAGQATKAALLQGYTDLGREEIKLAILSREELTVSEVETHKEIHGSALKVMEIIESNAAYEHAISALHPKLQEIWKKKFADDNEELEGDEINYEETLASLKIWLKRCTQRCEDNIKVLQDRNKIKDQILGQISIPYNNEEKLIKYEIHLDRKLERILSTLLKLQHIKGTAW